MKPIAIFYSTTFHHHAASFRCHGGLSPAINLTLHSCSILSTLSHPSPSHSHSHALPPPFPSQPQPPNSHSPSPQTSPCYQPPPLCLCPRLSPNPHPASLSTPYISFLARYAYMYGIIRVRVHVVAALLPRSKPGFGDMEAWDSRARDRAVG